MFDFKKNTKNYDSNSVYMSLWVGGYGEEGRTKVPETFQLT